MRIIIVGDSLGLPRPKNIRQFNTDTREELAVYFQHTYGFLLQDALNLTYPDERFDVINRSQRFFTIKNVYEQFADHLFFLSRTS